MRSSRSVVLAVTLSLLLSSCSTFAEPDAFRASFALRSYQDKPLPLPDGSLLLIGDSLFIDEAGRVHHDSRSALRGVVVHQLPDGTRRVSDGFMAYQRFGDTIVTTFFCRFGDVCPLVLVAPDTGVIRNDSLLFPARQFTTGARVYVRIR